MGLIATIHTTDIKLMAELVAAAKHHGPVEIRYVDGGLELHHAAGPDAVVVPLNAPAAPAASRSASKRKPATKKPSPAPVEAEDATLCPDCGHVANTANGLAIHRARRHGIAGAHASRRTPANTNKPAPKKTPAKPARTGTFRDNPPTRTPEKTPDPCPHCGRQFRIAAGRQRHIDTCGGVAPIITTTSFDPDAARTRAADSI